MLSPIKLKVKDKIEFKQIFWSKIFVRIFGLEVILSPKNFAGISSQLPEQKEGLFSFGDGWGPDLNGKFNYQYVFLGRAVALSFCLHACLSITVSFWRGFESSHWF